VVVELDVKSAEHDLDSSDRTQFGHRASRPRNDDLLAGFYSFEQLRQAGLRVLSIHRDGHRSMLDRLGLVDQTSLVNPANQASQRNSLAARAPSTSAKPSRITIGSTIADGPWSRTMTSSMPSLRCFNGRQLLTTCSHLGAPS